MADVVVVTAGRARSPGMTRADLIDVNTRVIHAAAEIDMVEVRAVGRFGRLFISGSENSVKTAIEAATKAIEAVEGRSE